MAQRRLTVQSDEAATRATRLAKRLGKSTTDIVVDALRAYEGDATASVARELSAEAPRNREVADHEDFIAFVRSLKGDILPGATSEHADLYDENGLPS